MSDELVFYTNPMSRGRIVRWMLEEVGAPYRTEAIGYGPAMHTPAYLAINPMGKVPAIVHAGTVLTETPAICAFLADAFPHAGLAPAPGSAARSAYYRWLFFAAGPLEAAVAEKAIGYTVPEDKRGMIGYGTLGKVLDTLETALDRRRHVAGDAFSAADVYLGSHLAWGMAFSTVEKRPVFETYVGPLMQRPAAVRAEELDDALVPPA